MCSCFNAMGMRFTWLFVNCPTPSLSTDFNTGHGIILRTCWWVNVLKVSILATITSDAHLNMWTFSSTWTCQNNDIFFKCWRWFQVVFLSDFPKYCSFLLLGNHVKSQSYLFLSLCLDFVCPSTVMLIPSQYIDVNNAIWHIEQLLK